MNGVSSVFFFISFVTKVAAVEVGRKDTGYARARGRASSDGFTKTRGADYAAVGSYSWPRTQCYERIRVVEFVLDMRTKQYHHIGLYLMERMET